MLPGKPFNELNKAYHCQANEHTKKKDGHCRFVLCRFDIVQGTTFKKSISESTTKQRIPVSLFTFSVL